MGLVGGLAALGPRLVAEGLPVVPLAATAVNERWAKLWAFSSPGGGDRFRRDYMSAFEVGPNSMFVQTGPATVVTFGEWEKMS